MNEFNQLTDDKMERSLKVLDWMIEAKNNTSMVLVNEGNMACQDRMDNVWIWYMATGYVVTHRAESNHSKDWKLPHAFDTLVTEDFVVALRHAETLCAEYKRMYRM